MSRVNPRLPAGGLQTAWALRSSSPCLTSSTGHASPSGKEVDAPLAGDGLRELEPVEAVPAADREQHPHLERDALVRPAVYLHRVRTQYELPHAHDLADLDAPGFPHAAGRSTVTIAALAQPRQQQRLASAWTASISFGAGAAAP